MERGREGESEGEKGGGREGGTHSTKVSKMADFPSEASLIYNWYSIQSLGPSGRSICRLSGICMTHDSHMIITWYTILQSHDNHMHIT